MQLDPSLLQDLQDSMLARAAEAYSDVEILNVGTILSNGYNILGLIGYGGIGAVYKAYDPELYRQVAINVLKPLADGSGTGQSNEIMSARSVREARILAQLSNQNVVTVHDVGRHEGAAFISMELVEGKSFDLWLADEKPDTKKVLDVLIAAGEGPLADVHRTLRQEAKRLENGGLGLEERLIKPKGKKPPVVSQHDTPQSFTNKVVLKKR